MALAIEESLPYRFVFDAKAGCGAHDYREPDAAGTPGYASLIGAGCKLLQITSPLNAAFGHWRR